MPIPADAPLPPNKHARLGNSSARYTYYSKHGGLLGYVLRFDTAGGKEIRPLTFCEHGKSGRRAWRWRGFELPRPLYGLDRLAAHPERVVLVCEGEKAADAAHNLRRDMVTISSPGGSKASGKTDWGPLAGRDVVIWPDADSAGAAYADDVVACLAAVGANSVAVIKPPDDAPEGWDAADALAAGWTNERIKELAQASSPVAMPLSGAVADDGASDDPHKARVTQSFVNQLITLGRECDLWRCRAGRAWATVKIGDRITNLEIAGNDFLNWLAATCFHRTGRAPATQVLNDAKRVLEAEATFSGPCHPIFYRIGMLDRNVYVDLADENGHLVEITANGWRVIRNSPIRFFRSPYMRALPIPEPGGLIESLRGFLNLASDEDFQLVVAWLVACVRPHGPFPILSVSGEQGSAKSTMTRAIRSLIDPSVPMVRSLPQSDRDLMIAAESNHVLPFDNISSMPNWLADSFCRLATGGGLGTRKLHANRTEVVFEGARPIILNGIAEIARRPDLADRSLIIHLPPIPSDRRRSEAEFEHDFEKAKPEILGALCDAVSAAIRYLPETRLESIPRMADFAKWATAAEPGLGWEAGTFMHIYESNRQTVTDAAIDESPVARAIIKFIDEKHTDGWQGTATQLLSELASATDDATRKSYDWPKSASQFGTAVKRVTPALRDAGYVVTRRQSGQRFIVIHRLESS